MERYHWVRVAFKDLPRLREFRGGWLLVVFFVLDMIGAYPPLNSWLVANFANERANPAGIILSNLVYDGWYNVLVLAVAAGSFAVCSLSVKGVRLSDASRFFVSSTVIGAVIGNLFWYLTGVGPELPVRGTSAVTMTSIGLCLVPALMVIAVLAVKDHRTKLPRLEKLRWRRENWPAPYLGFSLMLVAWLVAWLALVFPAGNTIIHGVSLMFGLLASTFYFMPKVKLQGV
ncbi:MAG: hypothetical protein JRM82_04610 [Nitrososphaerota archaeon]|nr:hypothetical protein [Nitrososphaerota archaeon]